VIKKTLTPEQQTIYELSERLVAAQNPIRVLDAVKWGDDIQAEFFKHKFKKLPAVDVAYYHTQPLPFDPEEKIAEFDAIERNVRKQLGQFSGVSKIMRRMCREYRDVVRMLQARGSDAFSDMSQQLYGSSEDAFYSGSGTLVDLAHTLGGVIEHIQHQADTVDDEKKYSAKQAVEILDERLKTYFNDPKQPVHVVVSDGIVADAAAGADKIKLRQDARFSERELRYLEVHEGWVHVGTTLNGRAQPICTFLSKGPPSVTQAQEGLAALMEIFTMSGHPSRIKRLIDRIKAIHMAEQGGNFIEVFNYYREQGLDEQSCYVNTVRVFRGSAADKAPFTKDLVYTRGLITIYNYVRLAVKQGLLQQIPLLFIGKTVLADLPVLSELMQQGLVVAPRYLPPQFEDLSGLSAWMSYSLFLNQLDLEKISVEFRAILRE